MAVIYETSADIPSFAGINQANDGYNMSLRFATDAVNCDVTGGALAPMRLGVAIPQELPKPIETLARLHRRYHVREDERDVLVAISDGKVYTKLLDHDDNWVVRYTGLTHSVCDYVTYEVNPEGSDAPIDVLLFTNAYDGMYCLYGSDLHVAKVNTPYKFGVMARHSERIWGSGILEDPDMLVYSAPFDPFNWEQNDEIPEDGAGLILQPSWDGDSFLALRPFGSQLLAFKRNTVWRIIGTHPGEYSMREQYGFGALVENTICVTQSMALMLGYGGMIRYDGAEASPFQQESVRWINGRMNKDALQQAYGVVHGRNLMVAVPIDGSEINNAVLMYNMHESTWSLMTGINVKAFLAFEDRLLYTSATEPGKVFEWGNGDVLPMEWYSGYQDLGAKSSVKSGFTLYFTVHSKEAMMVPITFRIRTEKKAKEKMLLVQSGKAMRVNINASGRFFRVEVASKSKKHWSLDGGIQIHCELDPD